MITAEELGIDCPSDSIVVEKYRGTNLMDLRVVHSHEYVLLWRFLTAVSREGNQGNLQAHARRKTYGRIWMTLVGTNTGP